MRINDKIRRKSIFGSEKSLSSAVLRYLSVFILMLFFSASQPFITEALDMTYEDCLSYIDNSTNTTEDFYENCTENFTNLSSENMSDDPDDVILNSSEKNISDNETYVKTENDTSERFKLDFSIISGVIEVEYDLLEDILNDSVEKNDTVKTNDTTYISSVGTSFRFNKSITLGGIDIYSIKANLTLVLPNATSITLEKLENPIYDHEHSFNQTGEHQLVLKTRFNDKNYTKTQDVIVFEKSMFKDIRSDLKRQKTQNLTSENASETSEEDINETEDINKTSDLNQSLENHTNTTKNTTEKTLEKDKEEKISINNTGISISMKNRYSYEYGPIMLVGNATSFMTDDELEELDSSVYMEFFVKDPGSGQKLSSVTDLNDSSTEQKDEAENKVRKSYCDFNVTGKREFYCEMPKNLIELTDYIANITIMNELGEFNIQKEFELRLQENQEISLDMEMDDTVVASKVQNITVKASKGDKKLSEADVSIQVTDPDGVVYNIVSEEIDEGVYNGEFYGLEPGEHVVKVTYAKGTEFKTITSTFRVTRPEFDLNLTVPDEIFYSTGKLNVPGKLEILDNMTDKHVSGDISVSIYTDDTLKKTCMYYCDGVCEFNCSIENYIEFTDYRIYATLFYDFMEFSTFEEFDVKFKEVDLGLDVAHKENYSLNEPQGYIITATDNNTGRYIEDATIYVKITDPDENVYQIMPVPEGDGRYSFEFVGIEPGRHDISMTFVKDAIFGKKNISIDVLNKTYIPKEDDSKSLNFIQLPAQTGNEVRWIREVYVDEKANVSKTIRVDKSARSLKINDQYDEDIALKLGNKTITLREMNRWNDLRRKQAELQRLIDKKNTSGFVEKVGLSGKIQEDMAEIKRLKKDLGDIDYNTLDDPELELHNLSGYNVISYETPAPRKAEKIISDNKKLVTVSSDLHYKKVYTTTQINETRSENIEVLWLKDDHKEEIEEIDFFDRDNDGLIDKIGWVVPHLSNQTFEVIINVQNESFDIDDFTYVDQYELARFVAKPNWHMIEDKEEFLCSVVINNISYGMQYDNGQFEYYHEFKHPGIKTYKVLCDDQYKEGRVEVFKSEDILPKRTRFSKTYYVDELFYMSESSVVPRHHREDDTWLNIDKRFIPEEDHYYVDRGYYEANLTKNISDEFILQIEDNRLDATDGYRLSLKPLSLVFYDPTTEEKRKVLDMNTLNEIRVSKDKNVVSYDSFFDFMDLRFDYLDQKIKQSLLIDSQALNAIPNPATFGMDERNTYLMLETRIMAEGLELPLIDSNDLIRLSDSPELYLQRDYYYTLKDEEDKNLMYRKISLDEDTARDDDYLMYSGIPYQTLKSYENQTLVFDPTFDVLGTGKDAMSVDDTIRTDFYSVDSPYLFFGEYGGETYETGLEFELDVPQNATIVSSYITMTPGVNMSNGTFTTNISIIDDPDDVVDYTDGPGRISDYFNYYPYKISWYVENWSTEFNYSTSDISVLLQYMVNRSDWVRGKKIAFLIDSGNATDSYRSLHDHSTPSGSPATLTVVYRADESRPVVALNEPENNTFTRKEEIGFNFTPTDSEGLDVCKLYGNFSGVWEENQTLEDPSNGTVNNFENITLDEGDYIWNVWCNDTMGNYRFNITDYELTVDRTAPVVMLDVPVEDANISSFVTGFNFSVSDSLSDTINCDMYLDSEKNVTDITLNSTDDYEIDIHNISTGKHNWSVSCSDLANNTFTTLTRNFTVSRNTTLNVWDEADRASNFSRYMNISFYANYTDTANASIIDSSCNITFNDSVVLSMGYDASSSLYVANRAFNISGNITYNVTCSHELYDSQEKQGDVYIYPRTNASVKKKVTFLSKKTFNVSIDYQNLANYSGYIEIFDFLHNSFNVSFDEQPTGSRFIDGDFFGSSYYWRFYLDALEKGTLSYKVMANESNYEIVKLYMLGFDASDSRRR